MIQLGAGNNYGNVDLIDEIIGTIHEVGQVQPVIAEWLTADAPLDLWPDVLRIRCFPIARYYRAFDFTISSVGYNSFNEIVSFGVPSLLVPNLNPMMDDQEARATFAENRQAAVHLDADLRPLLRESVAALHNRDFRLSMIRNCRAIARPNGAEDAAKLITKLAEFSGGIT